MDNRLQTYTARILDNLVEVVTVKHPAAGLENIARLWWVWLFWILLILVVVWSNPKK